MPDSGAYDVAYDIWINQTPRTTAEPNGTEIMVWLDRYGGVQPAGAIIAHNEVIGGHAYNVWYSRGSYAAGGTVSFALTSPVRSVQSLDIGPLVQEAVRRGYTSRLWYLIDVEAGFEIWQGGNGLAVSQFGVRIQDNSSLPFRRPLVILPGARKPGAGLTHTVAP